MCPLQDHLHQGHHLRRVEEMRTQEPFRPSKARTEGGYGYSACVARDDGPGLDDVLYPGKDLFFQHEVLRRRFNHETRTLKVGNPSCRIEPLKAVSMRF